jgi:hypothetical protein
VAAFILHFVASFFDKGRVFAPVRVAVNSAFVEIVPTSIVIRVFKSFWPRGEVHQDTIIQDEAREQHIHTNGDSKLFKLFLDVFPIFEELKVLVV